eukprot:TRINITY_DN35266_c0_g1_i1.p1 TRINITY_DN35266_c0_g1~~TRINITY_DN35266_c0_g1_i1.p1  ORF type:complete len:685 (-),score=137.67 TRINITY_DN35266_c0_g1_i1:65-2119(-)
MLTRRAKTAQRFLAAGRFTAAQLGDAHQVWPEDEQRAVISLNATITASVRAQEWAQGLALFHDARQRQLPVSVVTYGAALAACDRGSTWRNALDLLEQMGREVSLISSNTAISACARARRWQHAVGLLDSIKEAGLRPDTISYNCTMRSLLGSGTSSARWQHALTLLDELHVEHLAPSLVTFSTLASACEKGNAWQAAIALITHADCCGLSPDAACFSSAMMACARSRRWQRSVDLLRAMEARIVAPDVVCCNASISACERGGDWQGGLALLQAMYGLNLKPDLVSLNAAMSACEKGAQWSRALDLLKQAQESASLGLAAGPDSVSFGAVLTACARAAAWREGLETLEAMQRASMVPDPLSFTTLLATCDCPASKPSPHKLALRLGLWEAVLKALQQYRGLQASIEAGQSSTEKQLQEAAKKAVVGIDALALGARSSHGSLPAATDSVQVQFDDLIYLPVVRRLGSLLCRQPWSGAEEAHLQDRRLEEQFGLGTVHTQRALQDLGLGDERPPAWRSVAGRAARAALQRRRRTSGSGRKEVWPERPIARLLSVWMAYRFHVLRRDGSERSAHNAGLIVFAASEKRDRHRHGSGIPPLLPIFVEHDRGTHAERQALLHAVSELEMLAGSEPESLRHARGEVRLFAVHTPCISCLAVFCQFRAAFPEVDLRVEFDDWPATRQALLKV